MPPSPGDAPILATKLFVPPPRENLVARTRLRDRLAAARGGRVTLIAAAAGWGKSTLLADWAIAAPGRVAWLSLDAADDEPRRFLNYVIAALRAAEGIAADDLVDAISSSPEAVRAAVTELLNAIALRGAPIALVLDDYHSIDSRAVHDVVQFTIDHLPPNLHLVIATRADPPLGLSRLRARGLLLELRGDDLRFTAEEAGAFLNGAMGLTLDTSDIRELEQRTEGWVVGLQMAAISLSGREGTRAFIQRFSGSNRYVLDYLTDEVLDRQPEDVRQFLLSTSILTRLSPALCDAVLQRNDSERILQQLDAANLFLIPLDDVRYWYRYHHLFATLLQHHLSRARGAAEVAELHRRASEWYVQNRMPESALEHALAAHDVDRAIDLVSEHGFARTLSGDMATVVRWYDMLPRERIESDPELLLERGMAYLGDWQLPRAYASVLRAHELLTDDSPPSLRGAVLAMRGTLERPQGLTEEGNAHLQAGLPLVDENSFWYSFAHYQYGLTAIMEADARGLVENLVAVRAKHTLPRQVLVAVLAQTYTGYAEWWRGNPDTSVSLAHEMRQWIDMTERVAEGRPLECLPLAVLADVHASWNRLDEARAYAEKSMEHARRGIMLGLFESARTFGRVALAQRDWETADRAVAEAQRAIRNVGSRFYWSYAVDALHHEILYRRWQATGDRAALHAVEKWIASAGVLDVLMQWDRRKYGGLYCDAPLLLAARVQIEHGQHGDAVALLDEVWPHAVRTERLLAQLESLILRAIAEARRGRYDDALAAMTRALDMAARPRYIRPFVDEGPDAQPLVQRAASSASDPDFATRVLSAFDTRVAAPSAAVDETLSDRELEVLRLIAAGASNQEAARKLFIAPGTVKKHLENIYAKLQVGGRVEAVGRAREMKLL